MAEQTYNVHRLTGENFKLWKFQISAVLRGQGLIDIVTGDCLEPAELPQKSKWRQDDGKAMAILVGSLDSEHAQHVLVCSSAKNIWDKLASIHEKRSEVSVMNLYEEYFSLKMDENESVASYVSKVSKIAAELEDQDEKLSDNIKMVRIISSLTPKYKNFKTVWYNIKEGRDLNNLLSRLQLEEDQLNKAEKSSVAEAAYSTKFKTYHKNMSNNNANYDSQQNSKMSYMSIDKMKKITRCRHCNELGHWERECPKKVKNVKANVKKSRHMAFIANFNDVLGAEYKEVWLADSGATQHMTFNKGWFSELNELNAERCVQIANDQKLPICGYGKIDIDVWVDDQWECCTLENVLYVPSLKQNLFSIGSTTSKGFSMTTRSDKCELYDSEGELAAIGIRDYSNQFRMIFRVKCTERANIAKFCTLEQWHKRLGHICIDSIKHMMKEGLINCAPEADNSKFFCEDCQYGKSRRTSHKSSAKRLAKPGENLHVDLCGPMEVVGVQGVRYFLLVKDEATSFRYVFLISNKSEVSELMEYVVKLVEKTTKNEVKCVRSDNGTEFVNERIKNLFHKYAILHELTSPYTPEQNGFIERENRTIQESARTMLISSNLGKSLWPEAVKTAVYLLNRSLTPKITTTPFEKWFGERPKLEHIRVFGEIGYMHVPKQKSRLKWDSKSRKVCLVGYESTSKNFRVYDLERKKVVVTCDVIFSGNMETSKEKLLDIGKDNLISLRCSEYDKNEVHTDLVLPNLEELPGTSQTNDNLLLEEAKSTKGDNQTVEQQRYNLRKNVQSQKLDEMSCSAIVLVPNTYNEAMKSKDSNKWKKAIDDELKSLDKNNTWDLVPKPEHRDVIGCKWVFRVKSKPGSTDTQMKARLVAKGFSQKEGIDYCETFSPVVRYDSVRTLLAVAAVKDLDIAQFDIKTAFLNGDLDEEIFMSLPEGLEVKQQGYVCRLKKSLYGLKQAPRVWNSTFSSFLQSCNFMPCPADPCVYYDPNVTLQRSHENDYVCKFPYRQAVGSLMYAAIISRPDISYAVGEVSRFLENPNESHVHAVKRIFKYLKEKPDLRIEYGSESLLSIKGFTDADFARDVDTRKSTTGYIFMLAGGAITWRSHRQQTVSLSTTEAEFIAACEGTKEAVWLRQLLTDILEIQVEPTPIYIDNQSAIRLIKNPEIHHRTKHIDVRLHYIRELYQKHIVSVSYVKSEDQLADVFTKPLPRDKFVGAISRIGLSATKVEWEY